RVVAVSRSASHSFHKANVSSIRVVEGLGVEGDAHFGKTVQHIFLIKKDPLQKNLRQVHLMHAELFDELRSKGFEVGPGRLGENVTTSGVDILKLPLGTKLHLGNEAVVELTGVRNPCRQIEGFQEGLLAEMVDKDEQGNI